MNEISFGNAMVAVENGKDVQFYNHDCWHDYNKDSSGYIHKNLHLLKWRIKEEHIKPGQSLIKNVISKMNINKKEIIDIEILINIDPENFRYSFLELCKDGFVPLNTGVVYNAQYGGMYDWAHMVRYKE